MPMPKAAVNEYGGLEARKKDVGLAGQIFAVEAEPVSVTMEEAPHRDFGAGVSTSDPPHVL